MDGRVTFIAFNAGAGHRTDGQCIQNGANGVDAAGLRQSARILAGARNARCLTGTFAVHPATDLRFGARRSAIALEAHRAGAIRDMVEHLALRGVFAGILDGARILADLVDARLLGRALRVRSAPNARAGDVRIAFKSYGAGADRFVRDAGAVRVSAARQSVRAAHRCALAVTTRVRLLALAV